MIAAAASSVQFLPPSVLPSSSSLLVGAFPAPLLDSLHQLVQLADLLVAHLVHRPLGQHLPLPAVPFQLLAVFLPLGQEADNVQRILDVPVPPELRFEVHVANEAFLGDQLLPMGAQEPPVQRDGRKESDRLCLLARSETASDGRGEQTRIWAHLTGSFFLWSGRSFGSFCFADERREVTFGRISIG